jgi:hypothetical protein
LFTTKTIKRINIFTKYREEQIRTDLLEILNELKAKLQFYDFYDIEYKKILNDTELNVLDLPTLKFKGNQILQIIKYKAINAIMHY